MGLVVIEDTLLEGSRTFVAAEDDCRRPHHFHTDTQLLSVLVQVEVVAWLVEVGAVVFGRVTSCRKSDIIRQEFEFGYL